jgi:hypothetical protein
MLPVSFSSDTGSAMNSAFTTFDWGMWASGVVCQTVLLILMSKHILRNRFPVFFFFCIFGLGRDLSFPIVVHYMNPLSYFYAYWIQKTFEYLFILGVFYELIKQVFGHLEILPAQTFKLFLSGSMLVTGVLALTGAVFPAPQLGSILTAILYLDRGSAFFRAAILLLVLPSASLIGLRWRHYTFGIILGLGLYSTVELVMSAVGTNLPIHLGPAAYRLTRYIPNFAYLLSMLIWIEYFRKPEPAREQVSVEVLNGLKGVSNQLEDLYTSPVGMVRRLMWHSS